jgi:hypothetical protein
MNVSPGKLAAAGGVVTACGIALIMAAARQQGINDAAAYYEGRKKPCGCPEHDAGDIAAASAEMTEVPAEEGVEVELEGTQPEPVLAEVPAGEGSIEELIETPVPATNGTDLPEREKGITALPPRLKPADRAVPAAPIPKEEGLPPRPKPENPRQVPSMGKKS